MPKILLVNPPGNQFARARGDNWPSTTNPENYAYISFPILLATTAANLEKNGHGVAVLDCVAERKSPEELAHFVNKFRPHLILMLTSTPSYYYDVETRKRLDQEIPVAAVGVHASATPEEHLRDGFDYVLRGEFDFTALQLAENLDKLQNLSNVKGICFKEGEDLHISGLSELVRNLDELPFPAYHLLKMECYGEPFARGRHIMIMTSRGCPYGCSFCTIPVFYGGLVYRKRSPKLVVDEIEKLIEEYDLEEIYFDDSSITIDHRHLEALCDEIKNRKLDISWSCMGDVKISEALLGKLADSNCRGIKLGIETASNDILTEVNKPINREMIVNTIRKCRNLGLKVHGTYMFGMPGENVQKAKENIDFIIELNTDTAQIAIATPFPGTQFYRIAKEKGWLITEDWSKFDGGHAVLSYPYYSAEQIEEMFFLALKRWERHVLIKKPMTVFHHAYGVYKRQGLKKLFSTFRWSAERVIRGPK